MTNLEDEDSMSENPNINKRYKYHMNNLDNPSGLNPLENVNV